MKKSIIIAAAIAAMSAVSCSKNLSIENAQATEEVVFIVDDATKTAISYDGITALMNWKNTPKEYINIYRDGVKGTVKEIKLSHDARTAEIHADFKPVPAEPRMAPTPGAEGKTHNYLAVVADSFEDNIVSVHAAQTPVEGSFDPAADILLGKATSKEGPKDKVKLSFARANVISRLAFSNLGAGETVSKITINAYRIPIAGMLNPLTDCAFNGYNEQEGSGIISLSYGEDCTFNTVAEDGTFDVYFSSWATSIQYFTVRVYTDAAVYTKNSWDNSGWLWNWKEPKVLSFEFDTFKNINADMKGTRRAN